MGRIANADHIVNCLLIRVTSADNDFYIIMLVRTFINSPYQPQSLIDRNHETHGQGSPRKLTLIPKARTSPSVQPPASSRSQSVIPQPQSLTDLPAQSLATSALTAQPRPNHRRQSTAAPTPAIYRVVRTSKSQLLLSTLPPTACSRPAAGLARPSTRQTTVRKISPISHSLGPGVTAGGTVSRGRVEGR